MDMKIKTPLLLPLLSGTYFFLGQFLVSRHVANANDFLGAVFWIAFTYANSSKFNVPVQTLLDERITFAVGFTDQVVHGLERRFSDSPERESLGHLQQ